MTTICSSIEGGNRLRSILKNALAPVDKKLGYKPLVVWTTLQSEDKPSQEQIWLMVLDNIESDRQVNIGRPRRYETAGLFGIVVHVPKVFATLHKGAMDIAESIKMAFVKQNTLRPFILTNALIAESEPIEAWNRIDIGIGYRFQYFIP